MFKIQVTGDWLTNSPKPHYVARNGKEYTILDAEPMTFKCEIGALLFAEKLNWPGYSFTIVPVNEKDTKDGPQDQESQAHTGWLG